MKAITQIRKEMKTAKANRDLANLAYLQDLEWMAKRPSMKNWSKEQLIEQYNKSTQEHNITIEFIS